MAVRVPADSSNGTFIRSTILYVMFSDGSSNPMNELDGTAPCGGTTAMCVPLTATCFAVRMLLLLIIWDDDAGPQAPKNASAAAAAIIRAVRYTINFISPFAPWRITACP